VTLGINRSMLVIMNSADTSPTQLRSRQSIWLEVARFIQILIIGLAIILFIWSIGLNYEAIAKGGCGQFSYGCPVKTAYRSVLGSTISEDQLNFYIAAFVNSFYFLFFGVFAFLAITLIMARKKTDKIFTIFAAVMLMTTGLTYVGGINIIGFKYPQLHGLIQSVYIVGNVAPPTFYLAYPNGRLMPRWSAFLVIACTCIQILWSYNAYTPVGQALIAPLIGKINGVLFTGLYLVSFASLIYRYSYAPYSIEIQKTKWVFYSGILGLGGICLLLLVNVVAYPHHYFSSSLADNYIDSTYLFERWYLSGWIGITTFNVIYSFLVLSLPLSITFEAFRSGLWDIANRSFVHATLSVLITTLYIFSVSLVTFSIQTRLVNSPSSNANYIMSFLTAGIVAVLFQPFLGQLRRSINRFLYGERDDPATVLTRLSKRVTSALVPESILQTIVETLAQTLRLPYAAIALSNEEPRYIATVQSNSGQARELSPSEFIHLPLTYQTERVGELILAPRAAGESFSAADMKLINLIAQQAGNAAHTVQLNNDLRYSRERLVTAQEEERRRLRRDLHDGVGPTLASLSQRLDTAADLVNTNPEASVELLKDLKGQVKDSVAEIRRLVYALRPPVLDEFGLVSAIRELTAQYTGPNGLQIGFDVTEPMPPLPAAVEVAAYRIVLEAFTNITKHAQASECQIKIRIENNSLLLEISDNGKGLPAGYRAGIGFHSMRERTSELGGECRIENNHSGGTLVHARLPLGRE
jgi:signal transduction histidine kinase